MDNADFEARMKELMGEFTTLTKDAHELENKIQTDWKKDFMNPEELKNYVTSAVASFIRNDSVLLTTGAHEQAINHRIAFYLERDFFNNGIHVDCEYNKHLNDPKRINIQKICQGNLRQCRCGACSKLLRKRIYSIDEKLFRPDIVCHRRGVDNENVIVIEVKKESPCPFDEAKLLALTSPVSQDGQYAYTLGAFVYFPKGMAHYKWFIEGIETQL